MLNRALLVIAFLVAIPTVGVAADLTGRAHVIDGDTIDVGQTRVRIFGIDAPEKDQMCDHPTNGRWACGKAVSRALSKWIDGKQVACTSTGTDRYGRMIATCKLGRADIGATMVDQGLAFAYKKYSTLYVDQEKAALVAGRGLWMSVVVPPAEHRAAKRTPAGKAPDGCPIKGNVSADGKRIYHRPGQAWYDRTVIDTGKGERWFCSEAQARTAGWRRARR